MKNNFRCMNCERKQSYTEEQLKDFRTKINLNDSIRMSFYDITVHCEKCGDTMVVDMKGNN